MSNKPIDRAKYLVAVHLFFIREDQILLIRRANTGFMDGYYSVVAGHVDPDETVTQAAIREALEESGVRLAAGAVRFVHVMHRRSESDRVDFFVHITTWEGELRNNEPEKCDDLRWFPLDTLPEDTVPYVEYAIGQYLAGVAYSEFGWE